jgi:hypothetical protein
VRPRLGFDGFEGPEVKTHGASLATALRQGSPVVVGHRGLLAGSPRADQSSDRMSIWGTDAPS